MRLKSFAVVGTVGLLAIIGAVQAVRWACSWLAVALVCWGGWDIAEAAYAAPWIIVASTSGLAMSFYGMYEDNKRYKRSAAGTSTAATPATPSRSTGRTGGMHERKKARRCWNTGEPAKG